MVHMVKRYIPSLIVYVLIGGSAALVEWVVFATLVVGLEAVHYLLGGVLSFLVATYVNYLLSERYGFNSRGRTVGAQLFLVYAISALGLGISLVTLVVGTELLGLHVMIGKVAGTGLAFLWNFAGRQFIVFDKNPRWSLAGGRLNDRRSDGAVAALDPGPGAEVDETRGA